MDSSRLSDQTEQTELFLCLIIIIITIIIVTFITIIISIFTILVPYVRDMDDVVCVLRFRRCQGHRISGFINQHTDR